MTRNGVLEQISIVQPHRFVSAELASEFPSLFIHFHGDAGAPPHLLRSQWEDPRFDTWTFDCTLDTLAAEPFTLTIADDRGGGNGFPIEVLNRCQRLIDRRNDASSGALFDRVRRAHASLHDISRPLVRADYNHAVDVWQWLLRLDASASLALQLAALFHDIERLASEADRRVEHLAADYQEFKNNHASAGAEIAANALSGCGVPVAVRERAAAIIAAHEQQSADPEVALLNDADALSFFSLNSSGYADYFGPEQTRKKVAYTLNRMRPQAKGRLRQVRLRPDIAEMVNQS